MKVYSAVELTTVRLTPRTTRGVSMCFCVGKIKHFFCFAGFPGVDLEESFECSVEPVSSQHRQQGGHLLGGRSSGLPGQHADIQMSDQLTRHHRERRRDPSKRFESGRHTGRL